MNFHISEKMASLKPSAIREILKATSQPGIIPFAAGNPAPEAFPVQAVAEITADILKNQPIAALQYSVSEGYPALRETMKRFIARHDQIGQPYDDLIIVSRRPTGN